MQNKRIVSTKRMTCEIIGLFLVFFIIFSLKLTLNFVRFGFGFDFLVIGRLGKKRI